MCDLNYAIEDATPETMATFTTPALITQTAAEAAQPVGKEHGLCPDYQSAFRVGLGYLFNCGCNDITVTYTRLCTTDHSHVAGPGTNGGLWMTFGQPRYLGLRLNNTGFFTDFILATTPPDAFARERVRFEYNMVDGVVASRTMKGCDLWLRGYAGLRWAQICVNRAVYYEGGAGDFAYLQNNTSAVNAAAMLAGQWGGTVRADPHSRAEVWGIGPRVGLDLRYDIACGFGVGAHCGVSLLVGQTCCRFAQTVEFSDLTVSPGAAATFGWVDRTVPFIGTLDTSTGGYSASTSVHHNSHCHLVPEIDARLGLNYLFCCGDCFSLLIEVGWEFVSYINAIARVAFDDVSGHGREVCESYNMDGLYVSFKLSI